MTIHVCWLVGYLTTPSQQRRRISVENAMLSVTHVQTTCLVFKLRVEESVKKYRPSILLLVLKWY